MKGLCATDGVWEIREQEEHGRTMFDSAQDQLREEVYWLWRVHPPKRYEEDTGPMAAVWHAQAAQVDVLIIDKGIVCFLCAVFVGL